MRLLAFALLLLQGADERSKKLASQVAFERPAGGSDEARRVVELLTAPERWAAGFRTVEEKIGPTTTTWYGTEMPVAKS